MGDAETITLTGTSDLARVRQQALARAMPMLGPDRSHDVALVATELSANALEHGAGGAVDVRVGRDADALLLAVAADADGLPAVPGHDLPHHEPTGRGLRIVTHLVDAFSVSAVGRRVEVLCRFEATPHARTA